jgi:hypothetical protein
VNRPKGVTIIATIAIIFGVFTFIPKIYVISSPERFNEFLDFFRPISKNQIIHVPVILQISHGVIGSIIWTVTGIFMLIGQNRARILALIWGLTVILLTFFVSGLTIILFTKTALFVLIFLILMKRSSSHYFKTAVSESI